uniref:C2H2-type domain-containing protein n=1 Tax=Balaenoptera musculus TaxID=9771 RepID=A0A8C0DR57_BALMU
ELEDAPVRNGPPTKARLAFKDCGHSLLQVPTDTGHRQKPHICSDCGRGFAYPSLLTNHQQVHSGEPFLCPQCGKTFRRKSALKAHQWIHCTGRTSRRGDRPLSQPPAQTSVHECHCLPVKQCGDNVLRFSLIKYWEGGVERARDKRGEREKGNQSKRRRWGLSHIWSL